MNSHTVGEPIFQVKNVSLAYKNSWTMRNVTMQINNISRPGVKAQGQVHALLGPSGIGKSWLFRMLAGLKNPTSGSILVGRDLEPVTLGMVGVVAQNYPLFNNRTVLGNLMIGAQQSQSTDDPDYRSMDMLDRFHMEDMADSYPKELSGGQKQRVAIAQQVLVGGRFLLMDEPFSGLDAIMKDEVYKLIHEIATTHEHNTVIIITHDIVEAASVADTLWLMGNDHDSEGNPIPGARIQEMYNLMERGLAWDPTITSSKAFFDFTREVNIRFKQLKK